MQTWDRPDPLTRDLIHLINARRHDHWDVDAALDTLAELIEVGREDEILTVLAALDEDMAEWLFDLLAEAASTARRVWFVMRRRPTSAKTWIAWWAMEA